MKDAYGGIMNVVLVSVFLFIVSGILAMLVNYSKAFKMKNSIISAIEQYEGSDSCFSNKAGGMTYCRERIREEAAKHGYSPNALRCAGSDGYEKSDDYFCYKKVYSENGKGYYFTIVTQVDVDIPIVNLITGLSIFQVHGDTRVIKN